MSKLLDLLNEDIHDKNELKKTALATRQACLLMILYAIIFAVVAFIDGSGYGSVLSLVMILGYSIAIYMTYGKDIQRACIMVDLISVLGTAIIVIWFGWDSGIQHFLFALVLYNILFVRMSIPYQMLGAFMVCSLRLLLYFYCKVFDPKFIFSEPVSVLVQIISTIFVFMIICSCAVNYSIENQSTENTLRKYNRELERIAATDPLTQLWNRHKMLENMNEYLKVNDRFCSVSICDDTGVET